MKNNKSLFIYIAAYLALLIPSPGRFVYGFVIMFELLFLTVFGTLINSFIKKIKMNELTTVISTFILISFAIFYRQLFAIFYPEIAMVLGFVFYMPPVSLFLIGYLFNDMELPLGKRLIYNVLNVLIFIIIGLLFFLFRDLAGFGTFTFFGRNHQIFEKVILNPEGVGIFAFFASLPGAMFLAGITLFIHLSIKNKFNIIKNAEVQSAVR